MAISSVVLLGADGNLGPSIMRALLANGFNVTVLKRKSSKSPSSYPNQVSVSDAFEVDELVPVLQGKDAVIVTIRSGDTDLQKRIADASVKAGVKRFIPADFGSCDSSSAQTQALVPLYQRKTAMREYLADLSAAHPPFSWTSIVCGHFFDWSLDFLHIYPRERRAEILDAGDTRFSASSLAQVAEATAQVLRRPEVARNRMVYVQSFCVSQRQVVAAFERATGGAEWSVKAFESEAYRAERKERADAGDAEAVEDLVWYLGTVDADWTTREGFAMEGLGLVEEDLDAVVRRTLEKLGSE